MLGVNVVKQQRMAPGKDAWTPGVVGGQPNEVPARRSSKKDAPAKDPQFLIENGARIRARRQELGHPVLSKFAEKAGLDKGALSRIENGKTEPDAATARKLAQHLGTSSDWVLGLDLAGGATGGDGTPPPTPVMRSEVRPRSIPEHIRDWFLDLVQRHRGRHYPGEQVRAAEWFVAGLTFKLDMAPPDDVLLGALEAARELDSQGLPMEPAAMSQLMASRFRASAEEPTPEPVATRKMSPGLRKLHDARKKRDEQ